jgi:hypothetical protein
MTVSPPTIPAAPYSTDDPRSAVGSPPRRCPVPPSLSLAVLILDHVPLAANGLAIALRLAGHQVRTAYSSDSALEVLRAWVPDVAVVDGDGLTRPPPRRAAERRAAAAAARGPVGGRRQSGGVRPAGGQAGVGGEAAGRAGVSRARPAGRDAPAAGLRKEPRDRAFPPPGSHRRTVGTRYLGRGATGRSRKTDPSAAHRSLPIERPRNC